MILIIILFSVLLRLISINQSFWLDEATSITVARDFTFLEIINKFSINDFHPPFYYLMLKVWVGIFGVSEISARFLSVTFSTFTIFVVFKIGQILASKKAGLIAALFLATAPLHIYYSGEARMYVPLTFFVTLSIYLFLKEKWFWFSLSLIAILGTDYIGGLILPVFWTVTILQRKKFNWKPFLLSHLPLVLLSLIWLPNFLRQLQGGLGVSGSHWWQILGGASVKDLALVPIKFMIGRVSFENKFIYVGLVLLVGLVVTLLLIQSLINIKKTKLIWLWLILPIILAFITSLKVPILYYFRLIFCLPAFYLLLAVRSKSKLLVSMLILANIFFSLTYLTNSQFQRENWRGLTEFVKQNSTSESQVLFVENSQMEAYKYYDASANLTYGEDQIDKNSNTIWLMRYVADVFDPGDKVRQKVEKLGFKMVGEYNFNGVLVYKYENTN